MLNQSAPHSFYATGATPALMMETIKSRFGDITVETERAVVFPRGLLGVPDKFNFVLANFPSAKMQQFTLFQSLDDLGLSFITLPLEVNNNIIASDDIRRAGQDLQIAEANLVTLLIVSVHRGLDQVKLSVNARAPLFIDSQRKAGIQYVFPQDHYKVQHML